MGRPRLYESNADKQRAYRIRKNAKMLQLEEKVKNLQKQLENREKWSNNEEIDN